MGAAVGTTLDQQWGAAWWNTNPPVFYKDGPRHLYLTTNVVCDGVKKTGMCPHAGWGGPPNPGVRQTGLLYANSTDGLHWVKPKLGLVYAPSGPNGARSTANNIVLNNAGLGNGVFYDVNKGIYRQFGHTTADHCPAGTKESSLSVSASADGLHNWSDCQSASAMACAGDTSNNALWDSDLKQYLAFTRIDTRTGEKTLGLRREGRSVSTDFQSWSQAEQVLHGEANYESYALVPFKPAVGASAGLYFGLGMFYNITGNGSTSWSPTADRGKVYCELLLSPTYGANWTRVAPGTAYIPHGPPGSPDSHTTYAAARPFESPQAPGSTLLYYAGGNGQV